MSKGWSLKDKQIAKAAAERARHRAEKEAISLHAEYRIDSIEDLWALEVKIREWRRDRQYQFTLNFETANQQIADWVSRGWLKQSDIEAFSEDHLKAIKSFG